MVAISQHPVSTINLILSQAEANSELFLEFSKYVSGGHDKTLERKIFTLSYPEFNEKWLNNELANLREGEELAIHSPVYFGKNDYRPYHLPLIDFFKPPHLLNLESIVDRLHKNPELTGKTVYFFLSGHSLHGYVNKLLSLESWYKFLGTLLLINPYDQTEFPNIDSRWVGHSLENGFSALRISNNTSEYIQIPKFYKEISPESNLHHIHPF